MTGIDARGGYLVRLAAIQIALEEAVFAVDQ